MSYYNFEDFKKSCADDVENVIPLNPVLKDAMNHFNLSTKSNLLKFINNDGLENLNFINTKPWEKNPDPSNEIKIDAYEFRSLSKLGYIAFMYNETTRKWIIKSFHLSTNRNPAMSLALKEAGLIETEES